MTQEELLDALAPLALGPWAGARDLARACFEDIAAVTQALVPETWPTAARLPDDDWTPHPGVP